MFYVEMDGNVSTAAVRIIFRFTVSNFRGRSGDDSEQNLITLCAACHNSLHIGK
jgi:hypothetical protein